MVNDMYIFIKIIALLILVFFLGLIIVYDFKSLENKDIKKFIPESEYIYGEEDNGTIYAVMYEEKDYGYRMNIIEINKNKGTPKKILKQDVITTFNKNNK